MADSPSQRYLRTKKGFTTQAYQLHRASSIKRDHELPTYTASELRTWFFSQTLFHELFKNWVASDYSKWLKPSADRLDDFKPYSLDNIQLMTWKENSDKHHEDVKSGRTTKVNISVSQYTKDGVLVKIYHSRKEAERQTGIHNSHIGKVCLGQRKTAGGYIWK